MNLKQEMKGAKNEIIINKNGFLLGCGFCRCAGLDDCAGIIRYREAETSDRNDQSAQCQATHNVYTLITGVRAQRGHSNSKR